MPGVEARYYPPGEPQAKKIDEAADAERQERLKLLDTYWNYYEGKHHKPLKVEPGQRDDNVVVNLCSQAIDKSVAFFAPKTPAIQLPGETPKQGDESPAQQALDQAWEANDLEEFLMDLALAGFISGHPFVKLITPETPGGIPEVAVLDSRHVTVMWDRMNVKRPLWYRLQWEIDGETKRRQDIVPDWLLKNDPVYDATSFWTIIEYEQATGKNAGRWQEVGRDAWEYPFPPILDWKNGPLPHSYYGPSDLRYYGLNDAVNFVASNTLRIIKYHANPRTFVIGANLDQIKTTSIDGVWELPEGSSVNNLEMQSDLGSSMVMLETLRNAFFTQMRVVDWASQKDKVGALTNFGLRVLFNDMLDLIKNKHRLYGKALAELSRRMLIVMGVVDAQLPAVEWPDPLPKSYLEQVQAAALEKEKLGFTSDRTLAGDLGRDYDLEVERTGQEQNGAGDAFAGLMDKISKSGSFDRMMPGLPGQQKQPMMTRVAA